MGALGMEHDVGAGPLPQSGTSVAVRRTFLKTRTISVRQSGAMEGNLGHPCEMVVVGEHDWDRPADEPLQKLIERCCDRRDLEALSILLPAYILVDPPGLTDDWARVLEALYDLRARGMLPDDEKAELERVIVLVEQTVYPQ